MLKVLGGLLLLVVSPATINHTAVTITQHELPEDPHDFSSAHRLRTAHGLTSSSASFGAFHLVSRGIAKVGLVVAVLKNEV